MKKAKPSAEKGSPMMLPLNAMKPGQSSPSSKESAVPETAPIAKISANAFAQRRANASQTGSCRQSPMPSAASINSGMPTPSTAKTIWNPSEVPMIARERVTLSIGPVLFSLPRSQRRVGSLVRQRHVPTDERQARPVLHHHRRQPARRELRAQRVFVVIDDLRVLPELRKGKGVGRRDRGELAEFT